MDIKSMNKAELIDELKKARSRVSELEGALESDNVSDLLRFKRMLEGIDDLAYICDAEGRILYVNDVFEKYTGHAPSEFIGKSFAPLFDEQNLEKALDVYARTLKGESPVYELAFRDTGIVCEYKNMPLRDERGRVTGVFGVARDVMEKMAIEGGLRAERDMARKVLEVAGVIFVVIDADERVTLINEMGCRVLGLGEKEIIGKGWFDNFIPERMRANIKEVFRDLMAGRVEIIEYFENPVLCSDGNERIISWHNTVLRDESGRIYSTLSSGIDITEFRKTSEELATYRERLEELVEARTRELKEANAKLQDEIAERQRFEHELRKLSMAIEQSVNLVFLTDVNGIIEYVNPMFEEVSGWTREESVGKNPRIIASKETAPEQYEELWSTVLSGDTWRGVLKNKKRSGEFYWVSAVITPIMNNKGEITHFLAVQEDVTEKRVSSEKIQYLAHYDGTTGLINRGRFIELLNDWINRNGSAKTGALILLDIDQFKFISDTYGHGMGDEFLRRVARLLQITVRYLNSQYFPDTKETFVCRLSGDEFGVFLPASGRVEAVLVAEQIRKGLEGLYQSDIPCHLTVSLGIALFPEHGQTTTDLLTKADAAMYRAKDLGRNRFHLYTPEDRDIERMHTRLKWKESILQALKEDRFEAWFQPILSLADNTVTHYEVLARMRGHDGNIILPGPFIDIAERFGLVSSIGKVILEKALWAQAKTVADGAPLTFGVNVSGKELGDKEFLYFLQSKIAETGADPNHIIFEITETASILDLDRAVSFIRSLKSLGCRISLDDFGIGFTSFLYLKEMQVDFIKIAGSFIKNIEQNLNDQLFVRAITDVAKGMEIQTIAEFVEKPETMELLREFGVDFAQGYYVGRPAPTLRHAGLAGEGAGVD